MKKTITYLGILILMIGAANAQAPETVGGPLDQLLRTLQNVTDSSRENTKTIQDMPGVIETNFRRMISYIIVGNAAFITFLYSIIVFFDRMRQMKKKKTHEEYINDLEAKYQAREVAIIENFTKANKEIQELLTTIRANPEIKNKPFKTWRQELVIILLAIFTMLIIHNLGWF